MKFTQGQYQKVIADLKAAAGQLEPDGHCCAICDDTDHQAWECHHNPLVIMEDHERLSHNQCLHVRGIIGDDGGTPRCPLSFNWISPNFKDDD